MQFSLVRVLVIALCIAQPALHAQSLPELIDSVLSSHPSMRSQRAQGEAAQEAVIIEAKVNPSDVGQLAVGLPVSVKIDAFDYSVYGMLAGDLVYVSPDTLSEQSPNGQTQSYYRVKVHLPHAQPHNLKAHDIVVKPGMTVSLDIRTGTRSVLGYIAKPIVKAFGGALIER